jgi:hypothetical protein
VSLVDGDEPRRAALHGAAERRCRQPLGRDVQEPDAPGRDRGEPIALLGLRDRRVDEGRRDPARLERLDLVLHERDERRDDEDDAGPDERWELEARRLPRSRGHDDRDVVAAEHAADGLLLPLAERGVAERLPEERARSLQLGVEEAGGGGHARG